jgi:hypothetical protein
MEKKLFRVKVILYVMAENESEARVAATNARFDIFECTAKKADKLEPGWEDAIPYNAQDARTCAEIFSSVQPVTQPALPTTTYIEQWHPRVQTYSNSASMQASPR